MKKVTLLLTAAVFFLCRLDAETVYLNVNGNCLDRLDYEITKDKQTSPLTVYSLSSKANQKLFFNLSPEKGIVLDRLPAGMLGCTQASNWDLNTIRNINAGEKTVYLVSQTPQGYRISKVTSGAWMKTQGQEIEYVGRDFDFKTNLSYLNYGTKLSSSLSKSEVSLENYAIYDCSSLLTMRQSPNRSYIEQSTFKLIPEIGITGISYGYEVNKSTHKVNLQKVNGRDYNDYLSDRCRRGGAVVSSQNNRNNQANNTFSAGSVNQRPTSYGGESLRINTGGDYIPPNAIHVGHIGLDGVERPVSGIITEGVTPAREEVAPVPPAAYAYTAKSAFVIAQESKPAPVSYEAEDTAIFIPTEYTEKGGSFAPCGASAEPGYHIVLKGQTLYAISRQYGITVNQIKTWNALSDNNIRPCTTLRITAAGLSNPETVSTKPAEEEKSPVIEPELREKAALTTEATDMKWLDHSKDYTVKAGEQVADLAKRFGYTEERFRYINGLSKSQTLRVGQVLRTTDCNCLRAPQPYEARESAVTAPEPVTSAVQAGEVPTSFEFTAKSINKSPFPAALSAPERTEIAPDAYDLVSVTPVGRLVHVVEKGESLYSIAQRYNTDVQTIRDLNDLEKSEVIIPTQRLYVK